LVLPGSRARIVRCGGRYDPQLVKRSSEWVSELYVYCSGYETYILQSILYPKKVVHQTHGDNFVTSYASTAYAVSEALSVAASISCKIYFSASQEYRTDFDEICGC